MIRRAPGIVVFIAVALAIVRAVPSSPPESAEAGPAGTRRWVRSHLIVSLSNSLSSPPANIKDGSDVVGALRRAMQSWAAVADIQFFETTSSVEAISPANDGDGISLISVSTANTSLFESSDAPARTRVFYDSGSTIVEADIALNPRAASCDLRSSAESRADADDVGRGSDRKDRAWRSARHAGALRAPSRAAVSVRLAAFA